MKRLFWSNKWKWNNNN